MELRRTGQFERTFARERSHSVLGRGHYRTGAEAAASARQHIYRHIFVYAMQKGRLSRFDPAESNTNPVRG